MALEVSSTYQAIIRRGRAEGRAEGLAEGRAEAQAAGERAVILALGRKKFGDPPAAAAAALAAVTDPARLEELALRLLEANSWDELFAAP